MNAERRTREVGAVAVADLAFVADPGPVLDSSRRRVIGGLLLIVGAVAVLLGRALLAPDLPGVAAPAPWPEPPPVGSCVLLDLDRVDQVPCDQPHSGEVVATWKAGERPHPLLEGDATGRPITVSVRRTLPVGPQDEVCRGWAEQYTGWSAFTATHRGAGRWIAPQPVIAGKLVQAPPGEGTPDKHWTACVAQTQQPLYTGTLRSVATRTDELPGGVSICLNVGVSSTDFVDCDQPHSIELIAVMALTTAMMTTDTIAVDHSAAEVHQMCVATAALRTRSADPTYQGQLEVVNESVWVQRAEPVHVTPPGWLVPDCLIRVNGPGMLIGSVVGHGDGPLPWQN